MYVCVCRVMRNNFRGDCSFHSGRGGSSSSTRLVYVCVCLSCVDFVFNSPCVHFVFNRCSGGFLCVLCFALFHYRFE